MFYNFTDIGIYIKCFDNSEPPNDKYEKTHINFLDSLFLECARTFIIKKYSGFSKYCKKKNPVN